MGDVKKHVNYIAISWYIHSILMDNAWILGQK